MKSKKSSEKKYITIYQNNDKILELVQRINSGQVVESKASSGNSNDQNESSAIVGEAGIGVNFPGIVNAKTGGNSSLENQYGKSSFNNNEYRYIHNEAFYLKQVLKSLSEAEELKEIKSSEVFQQQSIKIGDFVVFDSEFLPNPIDTLFETLNVEWVTKTIQLTNNNLFVKEINDSSDKSEEFKNLTVSKYEQKIAQNRLLYETIYSFLEKEFKNSEIEEIFGELGSKYEAAIPCETRWFNTSNTRQIYNGRFTVFGKVSKIADEVENKLSKNKLTKVIGIDNINSLFSTADDMIKEQGLFEKIDQIKSADNSIMSDLQKIASSLWGNVTGGSSNKEYTASIIPLAIYI